MEAVHQRLDRIIDLLSKLVENTSMEVEIIDNRMIPFAPVVPPLGEGDTGLSEELIGHIRSSNAEYHRLSTNDADERRETHDEEYHPLSNNDVETYVNITELAQFDTINIGEYHRFTEVNGVLVAQYISREGIWETIFDFSAEN